VYAPTLLSSLEANHSKVDLKKVQQKPQLESTMLADLVAAPNHASAGPTGIQRKPTPEKSTSKAVSMKTSKTMPSVAAAEVSSEEHAVKEDAASQDATADGSVGVFAGTVQEKHPLTAAADGGRYAAAHRELIRLQENGDPKEFLDETVIGRISRIGSKFASAMGLLCLKPEDMKVYEKNDKLSLRWGMKLEGNIMQVVSIADFDADFLKMVCLDLEPDLENAISEDDIRQELFSSAHAHDVSWRKRMIKAGVGTKSDDIVMVSSIDALDEPLNSVCSLKYSLDKKATMDAFGTPIPTPDNGYVRTPYMMTATAFTPLAIDGDKMRGVRKLECVEIEMAPVVAKVLGVMPGFMIKKLCRGNIETKTTLTRKMLQATGSALDQRVKLPPLQCKMQRPPSLQFLEEVRKHICAL
jgi:hypothetical protein